MAQDYLSELGFLALGSRLRRAGALLQNETQAFLREQGCELPASHLPLLHALVRGGPMPLGELARRMGLAQPGVSRMVAALEEQGFVERAGDDEDQRIQRVSPTGTALELMGRGERDWWPHVEAAVRELLGGDETFLAKLDALEQGLSSGAYRTALDSGEAKG